MGKKLRSLLSLVLAVLLAVTTLTTAIPAMAESEQDAVINVGVIATIQSTGKLSGMYAMRNAYAIQQDDGTYLVTMHAFTKRDVLALTDDPEAAATDSVEKIYGDGDDGYWFTVQLDSLDEELVGCMSSRERIAAGKAYSEAIVFKFTEITNADVKVCAQNSGSYVLPPNYDLEVPSDEAEFFGYIDNIDETEAVSALDVLVAVHEALYGSSFSVSKATSYLAVDENGYVTKIFGTETSANGFLVNGGVPNDGTESEWGGYNGTTVNSTVVTSLDTLDFYTYSDTTYYGDQYTYVEAPETAEADTNIDVIVEGISVMMGYQYETPADFAAQATVLEGAGLAWVDSATGTVTPIVYVDNEEYVLTDEFGYASITVPAEPGDYYLTACSNGEVYALMNPVHIEVIEKCVLPFTDVKESSWYYNAVKYVFQQGIMTGTTATTFGPSKNLSRAQFATILYRMYGSVEVEYKNLFPDVKEGYFYTDAVIWAAEAKVITGYENGKFGPADDITREQLAVMLYRYAKVLTDDQDFLGARADLSGYTDATRVSSFAEEAMEWCVAEGIITGRTATTLDPRGKTVRAECATMIMRFDALW